MRPGNRSLAREQSRHTSKFRGGTEISAPGARPGGLFFSTGKEVGQPRALARLDPSRATSQLPPRNWVARFSFLRERAIVRSQVPVAKKGIRPLAIMGFRLPKIVNV